MSRDNLSRKRMRICCKAPSPRLPQGGVNDMFPTLIKYLEENMQEGELRSTTQVRKNWREDPRSRWGWLTFQALIFITPRQNIYRVS